MLDLLDKLTSSLIKVISTLEPALASVVLISCIVFIGGISIAYFFYRLSRKDVAKLAESFEKERMEYNTERKEASAVVVTLVKEVLLVVREQTNSNKELSENVAASNTLIKSFHESHIYLIKNLINRS